MLRPPRRRASISLSQEMIGKPEWDQNDVAEAQEIDEVFNLRQPFGRKASVIQSDQAVSRRTRARRTRTAPRISATPHAARAMPAATVTRSIAIPGRGGM